MAIKKILVFCVSGSVTSLIMELNIKTALKQLGIKGVEVDHTTIDDVVPGAADLFICGADLLPKAEKAGQAVGLQNMMSLPEMTQRLKEVLGK